MENNQDFYNKFYSTFQKNASSFSNESLLTLKDEIEVNLLHMELNPNLMLELELVNTELSRRGLLDNVK